MAADIRGLDYLNILVEMAKHVVRKGTRESKRAIFYNRLHTESVEKEAAKYEIKEGKI